MKQKLTTVAKITNVSEYILLFGLLGYAATKLWNTANWLRRKAWEETGKIPNYNQQAKELKGNRWYKSLHSQTAQAILEELHRAYLSWFSHRRHGNKKANPPGFRPKNSLSTLTFKKSAIRLIEGKILRLSIPKAVYGKQFIYLELGLRKNIELNNIRLARLVFNGKGEWHIHITYQVEYKVSTTGDGIMAIDLGIANLATVFVSNLKGYIYSGRELLSIDRYFAKEKAKCNSSRSRKCKRLNRKLGKQRRHFLHAVSKQIVLDAIENNVGTIVIGNLTEIRKDKDWGHKQNQALHAWPFRKLTHYITYKAAKYGISVELINEAYTSQTCSNCGIRCKSNRIHRGLYVCQNCGRTINADLNGAINILKKYLQREGIPEGVVGEVARPLVNLFVQRKTELKSREQGTFLKKAA